MSIKSDHQHSTGFSNLSVNTATGELEKDLPKEALPTIRYDRSKWFESISKCIAYTQLLITKLWMYISFEMQPEALPITLQLQLKDICLSDNRQYNRLYLVRLTWNTFQLRENGRAIFWLLYINKQLIN